MASTEIVLARLLTDAPVTGSRRSPAFASRLKACHTGFRTPCTVIIPKPLWKGLLCIHISSLHTRKEEPVVSHCAQSN